MTAFGLPNFTYEDSLSNAVRVVYTPRVFSANEAPPETTIFLHHEMAQTPVYPSKLFFFCQKAAEEGGSTTLCRSDELWERIEQEIPGLARDCIDKGLKYSNVMPAEADLVSGMGRSWQSTLSVDSHEEAEARLSELGYRWEWMEQDELRVTSPTLPAVRELDKGKRSFFNQLIAAFKGGRIPGTTRRSRSLMAMALLSILRKSNGSANWRTKSPLICIGRQATSPSWTTTCACTDDGPSKEPARFSLPWLQHEFWL